MKNVIIGIFPEEAKAYETLSNLKTRQGSSTVVTAGIIKNENENIYVKDGYDFDNYEANWATGGLIGGLIGLLAGPIGLLLGGGIGTIIGSSMDMDKAEETNDVGRQAVSELKNHQLAIVMIAEETTTTELDEFLHLSGCNQIIRESYVDVQAKVYQAKELEEKLAKQAKQDLHEAKKEKWHAKAEAKKKEFDDKVDRIKNKITGHSHE